jgi:putative ABC transport system permease protein
MPRDVWVRYTGDERATTAALWLDEGVSVDQVSDSIRAVLSGSSGYEISAPADIRKRSLGIFDRTFAVTYLLEAVAVLIGLFGISASTSSQVLARRGEFGMLRHLGVTRHEISRMLAFEGAALGAVGVVAGLVVGALVSVILIYVVNRQSFHWTMDVYVPWALLGLLSLVLIAAAAFTSVVSGRQAMGPDVVRAVRGDW